jgi:branched-chain amino acid transport system substrate-binding protein
MSKARRIVLLACSALLVLYHGSAEAQPKDIVIGVATAMTGAGAATGQQIASGVALAVKEVNAAGGIKGSKVKLVVEDDRTLPGGAVNAFNKLVSEKPEVIIGPTWTNFMLTLSPIIKRNKIPVLTSATGTKVTDPDVSGGWIFRSAPSIGTTIQQLVGYVAKTIAPKRPAIIYSNDEWGKSGYEAFKAGGIKFAAEETFNFGDKDVSAQVLKLKEANPDAVVIWNSVPADAGLITNQIRQFIPSAKIIGSSALAVDEYYHLARSGGDGVVTIAAWVPGSTPQSGDWAKRLKANDPNAILSFTSAQSYDAAMIAFRAIKAAADLKPETIRAALAEIKDFDGVVGKYAFDERGDGLHAAKVVEWQNGIMKPVASPD